MASRAPSIFLVLAALLFGSPSIAAEPSRLIAFRADLWPGVKTEANPLREVHFYTNNRTALSDACLRAHENELSAFFADERGRLQFGEICGELVVLTHPEAHKTLSQRANKFIGAHETFHLVAQIFGGHAPSILAFGSRPKDTPGSNQFFKDLTHALESRSGREDWGFAAHFAQSYESLSVEDKAVVDYYSTVEWPAEYYAYKVLANEEPGWSFKSYITLRREIADEPAYVAAVPAGLELDRALGSGMWEQRVIKGETMFGMLSKLPATAPGRTVEQINITSYPLTF